MAFQALPALTPGKETTIGTVWPQEVESDADRFARASEEAVELRSTSVARRDQAPETKSSSCRLRSAAG
jgi:hypothetical protein